MSKPYSKLRGRITEKYGTIKDFAGAFGVSAPAMNRMLTTEYTWNMKAIEKARVLLDITPDEVGTIFLP